MIASHKLLIFWTFNMWCFTQVVLKYQVVSYTSKINSNIDPCWWYDTIFWVKHWMCWAILEKKQTRGEGCWGYTFFNPPSPPLPASPHPGIFDFLAVPLEIPDKTKIHPWKFHKIVLDLLKITRHPWNFHLEFLGYPWKVHFVFN